MDTIVEDVELVCPLCHVGVRVIDSLGPRVHVFVRHPRVLTVVLNRWTGLNQAALHTISVDRILIFHAQDYELASTVCHLGPSPPMLGIISRLLSMPTAAMFTTTINVC